MAKGPSTDTIDKDTKSSHSVLALIIAAIIILVIVGSILFSKNTSQTVSLPIVSPASLEAARDLYIDGNYLQAIELLEAFIDRAEPADQKLPLVRDQLVSSYWQVDDHQQAFALLSEVVSANPGDTDSIYRLGLLAKELGRDETAAEYFSQAISSQSGRPQYHTGYAETLTTLGRHEEAREQWQIVMSLTPADSPLQATVHGKIGNTYAAQNLPDAARAEFEAGLDVAPDDQYLARQLEALGP